MLIRTDLVLKAARNHFRENNNQSNDLEIHAVNRFYTVAFKIDLGINPLHLHDRYCGRFNDDEIALRLVSTFDQVFHVSGILSELITYMRGVLYETSEYDGMRTDGYSKSDLQKALDYINTVLSPITKLGFEDGDGVLMRYQVEIEGEEKWVYKQEQPQEIIEDAESLGLVSYNDLNWPVIKKALFVKLTQEHYFDIPEDAMACLDALLSNRPYDATMNFSPLLNTGIVSHANSLYQLLTFANFADDRYKRDLLARYVSPPDRTQMDQMKKLFDLMNEGDSEFKKNIHTLSDDYKQDIEEFIKKKLNGEKLRQALINNDANKLHFFFQCLPFLKEEDRKKIILYDVQQDGPYANHNALDLAAQFNSSVFQDLMKHTSTLTPEEKTSYLLHIQLNHYPFIAAVFKKHTQVVKIYLEALNELSPEEKYSFLRQKACRQGFTIFEMILYNVPSMTSGLLAFIQGLSMEQQYDLMKHLPIYNVSNFDLFKNISELSIEMQNKIYKERNHTPCDFYYDKERNHTPCDFYYDYGERCGKVKNKEIWQYELKYRVKRLQAMDEKNKLGTLLSLIPDHLNEIKSYNDWKNIERKFKEELLKIAPTIQRSKGEAKLAFLINFLICLTIVGALVVRKRLNNPTYRHPFFSEILSVTEKDGEINELQRQITWH